MRIYGFPKHHAIEELSGFVASAPGVGDNAGERRCAKATQPHVVVDADDSYLFRYGNIHVAAHVKELLALDVVTCHYTNRLRQSPNPCA